MSILLQDNTLAYLFPLEVMLGIHDRLDGFPVICSNRAAYQAGAAVATKTRPEKLVPKLGHKHPGGTILWSVEPLTLVH